jgi:hypothetical protein
VVRLNLVQTFGHNGQSVNAGSAKLIIFKRLYSHRRGSLLLQYIPAEKISCIVVADILHDFPDPFYIIWQFSIFHFLPKKVT